MLLLAIFRVIVGGFATVGCMTLDVSGWQTVSRFQALSKEVEQAELSSKIAAITHSLYDSMACLSISPSTCSASLTSATRESHLLLLKSSLTTTRISLSLSL